MRLSQISKLKIHKLRVWPHGSFIQYLVPFSNMNIIIDVTK